MIELIYFHPVDTHKTYQLVQFRSGEPWKIVEDGEFLGSVEKLNGNWHHRGNSIEPEVIKDIGSLIDQQNFNQLPLDIKTHWIDFVQETIAEGDNKYLIICKPLVDVYQFKKVFKTYICMLVKDPWEIHFRVYDSNMSNDFEVFVKHQQLVR